MTNDLTPKTVPQCTAIVSAHSRQWRCGRRAAKKHGYKFCGHHAPTPPVCGRGGTYVYHRTDCAGCRQECCRDRSLCVPGKCFVRTDDGLQPAEAVIW